MLTNVHEYDDITRLTFHVMLSLILFPPCLNSLSGNSANNFRLKVSVFCQMFRSKSKKLKNGLKLKIIFTVSVQLSVENRIFPNYV